mmetsp:Transcript_67503/g.126092  ORF Transcript_67503/g.126092 Transcript_67503/m.126092 type:complete len:374 (+) Transcript_67503:40-1161(+)
MMEFKLCSWNLLAPGLHEAHEASMCWEHWRPALRSWLHRLSMDHDILCFQEAEKRVMLVELDDVLGPLGFDAVALDRSETLVNATFFRRSIFTLTRVDRRSRVLLSKLALQDGRDVMVVNVHLEAGDHESQRISQLSSALKRATAQRAVVTVLCGDFNSTLEPTSHLRRMLNEFSFVQCKLAGGVTYSVEGYTAVLDHIWADADLSHGAVLRSEASAPGAALCLPDLNNPSDHLPITGMLTMPLAEQRLLQALSQPVAPAGARQPNMDILDEWHAILRSARPNSKKRSAKEQRKLEKVLLDVVQPEEAVFMQGSRTWASNVAAVVVASVAAKASVNTRAQGTDTCMAMRCTASKDAVASFDLGSRLRENLLGG